MGSAPTMTILNIRTATGFALICVLGTGLVLEKDGSAQRSPAAPPPAVHQIHAAAQQTASEVTGELDVAGSPADPAMPGLIPAAASAAPQLGSSGGAEVAVQDRASAALAEDLRRTLH